MHIYMDMQSLVPTAKDWKHTTATGTNLLTNLPLYISQQRVCRRSQTKRKKKRKIFCALPRDLLFFMYFPFFIYFFFPARVLGLSNFSPPPHGVSLCLIFSRFTVSSFFSFMLFSTAHFSYFAITISIISDN